ncbi:alkaline phosphatase [Mangrovibacterium sp.]|uniref:alkaline phosphatase D family protein n=1 Tax=Mangrovibacterium sp. TaxID=1961364 RepID=UPI0035699EE9
MRQFRLIVASLFFAMQSFFAFSANDVYFTTGLKIGEVTESSAVIWTRLCNAPTPVSIHHQRKEAPFRSPVNFDNNSPVGQMDGAVEGAFGQVKVTLISASDSISTDWEFVSPYQDFTLKKTFSGLTPNTEYQIKLEGRRDAKSPVSSSAGSFKTAPLPEQIVPVTFTSTSCQYFWDYDDSIRGFKIYDNMLRLHPDFQCQTGDFVYYDKPGPMAYTVELARHKWHAMNSWPSLVDFYSNVPVYLQKDDHDMLKDDASPKIAPLGELTFSDALKVWDEQAPLEGSPYRTFRWGKDVQVWIVEGREFRSENKEPDGPNKTIWGTEQKEWFIQTMNESDATFKILVSQTPVVGPDRETGKNDNYANKSHETEGKWVRQFLAGHKNTFVINGDRHWQYVSTDLTTGLMEFSQGPSSDSHAQGWNEDDIKPEHKFLRVKGGFLAVNIYRENDQPMICFTHYDVDGNQMHQEIIKAKK